MKKIKAYVFGLLLTATMLSVSACGSNNKTNESQSGSSENSNQTTTSQASSGSESSAGNNESMKSSDEESTGVIDGVINDVEKGVDDMTGNGSSAGETSTQAGDQ